MSLREFLFLIFFFYKEIFIFRINARNIRRRPLAKNKNFGVNLAGYLTAETGVGEGARSIIRILEKTDIPFVLNNIRQRTARSSDNVYSGRFGNDNPYCLNILHVNADMVAYAANRLGLKWFRGRYNIGYWFWELDRFPERWRFSFECFNEVWVPSVFCRDCISKISPVPVIRMPPSIDIKLRSKYDRSLFGLYPDAFVLLSIFDLNSYSERKNPFALISAFRDVFAGYSDRKVVLVLKFTGSRQNKKTSREILKAVHGLPVKIIDNYLERDSVYGLISVSDCYVSLHRSEGFGLPLAEAMYIGKTVIATGYSGNMEFMNEKNSLPVKFVMKKIERTIGPYEKGNYWAEPDVKHAADLMRNVYENRDIAENIGSAASKYMRENFSPETLRVPLEQRLKGALNY